jgi:hypothetical protein
VYDVFLYDRGVAVVLTSSRPVMADAVQAGLHGRGTEWGDARHEQRVLRKAEIPPERLLEEDPSNRLILWSQVTGGRLHRRRLGIARLVLRVSDGDAMKLIWMPRGPFNKWNPPIGAVADVLRQVLGARIVID